MTEEEIMFERLFAPIKAKIQDKNRYITDLEKENAELKEKLKVDRQCEACTLGDFIAENSKLKSELKDLKIEKEGRKKEIEELQYKLKCRDDELAAANARIHQLTQEAQAREATLNQKLRRTETKLKLAAQDYLVTKPAWFYGYGDELEERARKQEELEDDCAEDKMALIKMEEEINGEE